MKMNENRLKTKLEKANFKTFRKKYKVGKDYFNKI